jgi:hypothetical protein
VRRPTPNAARIRVSRDDQSAARVHPELEPAEVIRASSTGSPARQGVGARVRYRFDTAMAKGPSRVLWWLGAITVVFALIGGVVLLFTDANTGAGKTVKDLFLSLVATVDGGGEIGLTGGFTGNWWYLLVSFVLGFGHPADPRAGRRLRTAVPARDVRRDHRRRDCRGGHRDRLAHTGRRRHRSGRPPQPPQGRVGQLR